jgi:hypothetical protein
MKALFCKSAFVIAGVVLLVGCQKDISDLSSENALISKATNVKKTQEHMLKGEFPTASYWVVPGPGWVNPNPAPAWYPGTGEGHMNLLGKAYAFVNMYVTLGQTGLQGTPAPINLFFSDELSSLGIQIPDAVTIFIFDKQGNSIWGNGAGTLPVTPVSETRVLFSGPIDIIGGTGKFANASGSFRISGYFNPQNRQEAALEITDGTIEY